MLDPSKRKKAFSPKVRTGCDVCKKRRIKCDEAKPRCFRCKRRGLQCHYSAPKVWIFEAHSSTQELGAVGPSASFQVLAPVFDDTTHAEERQALQFFVSSIAPWMADHGAPNARGFWVATVPKMYHAVPATRHLVTALGLLEMRIANTGSDVLIQRSMKITQHYTKALHEMASPAANRDDMAVGPILAWLLEVFMNNGPSAAIHAHAARKLAPEIRNGRGGSGVPQCELDAVIFNMLRSRALRGRCDLQPCQDTYVAEAVTWRNKPIEKKSTVEIRRAFEDYFEKFSPQTMTSDDVVAAEEFITRCESDILANAYLSDEASVTFSALHFLCMLSMFVLPQDIVKYFPGTASVACGLDFVLESCENMLELRLPRQSDQESLQEIVGLNIHVLGLFAPKGWQRRRSDRLIRVACMSRKSLKSIREAR